MLSQPKQVRTIHADGGSVRILHTRWLRVCSPICCAIVLELDIGDLKNLLNRHILVLEGIIMLVVVVVVIVVNESALIEPPLKYVLTLRQHFAKYIRGDVLLEQESLDLICIDDVTILTINTTSSADACIGIHLHLRVLAATALLPLDNRSFLRVLAAYATAAASLPLRNGGARGVLRGALGVHLPILT